MGVDITFNAVFPAPKPAAVLFTDLWTAFSKRHDSSEPLDLRVYELTNSANPIAVVKGLASDPNVRADMTRLLGEYGADRYSFQASWGIRGARDGHATRYGTAITVRSPLTRRDRGFGRDIDVTWDVGDSRRFTPEGKDDYPNVDQLISDLQVLIELGASSIWAAGPDRVVNPLALYAVYHRALGDYADDGTESPFPKWPIDLDHIEIAHEYALKDGGNQRLLTTDAGPIVYSPLLVRGTLNMFYAQLDRVLKADIEDQMERTGAAGYKAYEYTENQKEWIAVERVSDEAPLLRVDFLRRDGDVLTIAYTLVESGINDRLARTLIRLSVLQGLYHDTHGSLVNQVRYQNTATGTEDIVPYAD